MMSRTHIVLAVAATSLVLGTADGVVLSLSAVCSQLPDIDTTYSFSGKIFFPLSSYLEKRFAHRSITHSFLALSIFAVVIFPVTFFGYQYYLGMVSGYFWGFFGDVFTKSGVALFYPSKVRAICPANPRLRLSTGSSAEWFVLFILIAVAIFSININSTGGIVRAFNQGLGLPSGAIETVNQDASRYLLTAHIKGRNAITQEPIEKAYEIIQPLNQNDLLVKDDEGINYRVGFSVECQIIPSQIKIERVAPITTKITNLFFDDEEIYTVLSKEVVEGKEKLRTPNSQFRTYLSGTLTIFDPDDLILPTHIDRYDTITLQPASDIAYARLIAASRRSDSNGTENNARRIIMII
jgi:inner membrane protein